MKVIIAMMFALFGISGLFADNPTDNDRPCPHWLAEQAIVFSDSDSEPLTFRTIRGNCRCNLLMRFIFERRNNRLLNRLPIRCSDAFVRDFINLCPGYVYYRWRAYAGS